LSGSERQNVIRACDIIRHSPLIGPRIPVHGLLLDLATGKLESVVNGYDSFQNPASVVTAVGAAPALGSGLESLGAFKEFALGEMKFPDLKIGELAGQLPAEIQREAAKLAAAAEKMQAAAAAGAFEVRQFAPKTGSPLPPIRMKPAAPPPLPPKKMPLPPPIRPGRDFNRG
jgi:carbonic anhydrase